MIAASSTMRSTVSRNTQTMVAATEVVSMARTSQGRRLRIASPTLPRRYSSPEAPEKRRMSSVVSASMMSITSSKVTRPSSRPAGSTTGTDTRL